MAESLGSIFDDKVIFCHEIRGTKVPTENVTVLDSGQDTAGEKGKV